MNKIIISIILVGIVLSGCIGTQDIMFKGDDNSTIALYKDGQMTIRYMSTGNSYGGVYTTHGDTIVLTFGGGYSTTLTKKDNDYIDTEGNLWHTQT